MKNETPAEIVPHAPTMRLCAASMIGPDPQDAAAYEDAAASVCGLVDGHVVTHPGEITDFAAARNALLRAATADGFNWALMLDADERIACPSRAALETTLRETRAALLLAHDQHGMNCKERLIRLPARGAYQGAVHEAFAVAPGATRDVLPVDVCAFWELEKTEAQLERKATRDLALLEAALVRNPDDARAWFFAGSSHSVLMNNADARACYEMAFTLGESDEVAAQAARCIALTLIREGRFGEALTWCSLGMARHAGLAELPCLAGLCSRALGQPHQALRWLRVAKALGCLADTEADDPSVFLRDAWGQWEMPYGIGRHILREVKADAARIAEEDRDYARACAARLARYPRSVEWPGAIPAVIPAIEGGAFSPRLATGRGRKIAPSHPAPGMPTRWKRSSARRRPTNPAEEPRRVSDEGTTSALAGSGGSGSSSTGMPYAF